MPRIACLFNYAPHYRELIYRLMDDGLHCDFYFGSELPFGEPIKKMDVRLLRGFKRESPAYRFRFSWQTGYPWLSLHRYDVFVVTADASLSSVLLLILCRALGKRLYLWGHGPIDESQPISHSLRWFYLGASGWFLYGERAKRALEKLGAPPESLHVVYNSLNYDQQVEVRSHLSPSDLYARHFGNRDPVLIFVGRLTPWKQLDLLMAAAGQLHAAGAPVNVVIVGEGQIADTLRSEAEQRGIESRVWFFGACFDERALGELFANAAACVSPGEVGLTAMHAMVYGCPVVTHGDLSKQMPECEAVVEGATGALFARDDAESLLRAIQRVLALDRAHVAAQCRRMIDERYNPHRQIETLKAALSS